MSLPKISRASQDALAIWQAGVQAVTPREVFARKVACSGGALWFDDVEVSLAGVRRIVVVGAGKAAASMVQEFVRSVGDDLAKLPGGIACVGWVNCPEGTFDPVDPWVRSRDAKSAGVDASISNAVFLCAARPAGMNVPTEAAVNGTQQILKILKQCDQTDLVLCMLSGGGSALLVAPPAGITLADKQAVAGTLAAAGADIEQLNAVRRCLSEVKGGGLGRACRAPRMVSLIISDVLGDPLEVIASGPTIVSSRPQPELALEVLRQLGVLEVVSMQRVVSYLEAMCRLAGDDRQRPVAEMTHLVLANNADAVDAAGVKAVELGYRYVMQVARQSEGDVKQCTSVAVNAIYQMVLDGGFDCWISGGEPSVKLPENSGKGGRNQQLALGTMHQLIQQGWPSGTEFAPYELAMVSGGTDGEDGPTDAAGAYFDEQILEVAQQHGLAMLPYLDRADAYHFFERTNSLIKCGPTGTNVCDLRVAVTRRK